MASKRDEGNGKKGKRKKEKGNRILHPSRVPREHGWIAACRGLDQGESAAFGVGYGSLGGLG